jgi:putative redox protein
MQYDHRVKWAGGLRFIGTGASGHSVVIDGDKNSAVSPMEMMLLGTGGCACIDLVMILEKARQKVVDAWVDIGGERREELPRYFTDIEMHFVVKGIDIKEHHVKRAIDLAMKKYCSASAQMAALADIKTSYEIIESDTP